MELIGFRAGKLLPRNVILDMRQPQILDDERSAQDLVFGVEIRIWIHHDAQTFAATGDVPFSMRDLRTPRAYMKSSRTWCFWSSTGNTNLEPLRIPMSCGEG